MKLLFPFVAITLAIALLQFSMAADAEKPSLITSALMVLTGNDSHVLKPAYIRVQSAAEWKKTWLGHLGLTEDTIYRAAMEVDFNRCIVIAVFGDNSENSCGYRIDSVREDKNSIVVRLDDISYQTEGPDGGADRVAPYAFIVLPKSKKTVILEKNEQIYIGEAAEWKEVARLK